MGAGVRTSRFMTHGQTPNYKHSSRPTPASFRTTNAQNGVCKIPPSKSAPQLLPPQIKCPRSPLLSSFLLLTNWPSCQQPGPIGKMLKMLRKDVTCRCPIKRESPAKSCADGSLTATRVRTAHRSLGAWHCTSATQHRFSTAYLGH
jgi:hypothetical protein